jgi:hypothetical protein
MERIDERSIRWMAENSFDSEEKREPASDVDTAVAGRLKAQTPNGRLQKRTLLFNSNLWMARLEPPKFR